MISKLIGSVLLVGCLSLVYMFETSSQLSGVFRLLHWPAIFLTGIGPVGIVLLSSEWLNIKELIRIFSTQSPAYWEKIRFQEAETMQQITQQFYSIGTKSVDNFRGQSMSPSLRSALDKISIKVPMSDIRDLLEKERDALELKFSQAIKIAGLGLRMAPSVGMLGTILGMTQLLSSLKDPSNIGSHMSLALLTTFYGLFFSLVLWTPLQTRLEALLEIRASGVDRIIHWLELLEKRKPVHYLEDTSGDTETSRNGARKMMPSPQNGPRV